MTYKRLVRKHPVFVKGGPNGLRDYFCVNSSDPVVSIHTPVKSSYEVSQNKLKIRSIDTGSRI